MCEDDAYYYFHDQTLIRVTDLYTAFCDHCACPLTDDERHPVTSLPAPIQSAGIGESAILCASCYTSIIGESKND